MSDKETIKYIIGIDEVGRGPIAGPVAVCAFQLPITNYQLLIEEFKEKTDLPLRDSKKLTKKQREVWFLFLKKQKEEGNCDYAISFVSPENIDKFGIAKCIQKALNNSLLNLSLAKADRLLRAFVQTLIVYTLSYISFLNFLMQRYIVL